jgi:hypothetical protein
VPNTCASGSPLARARRCAKLIAVMMATMPGSNVPTLGPVRALARRDFRDGRTRTIAFAYVFPLYAYIQPVGFRHAYPTLTGRLDFAHSFARNDAPRLF